MRREAELVRKGSGVECISSARHVSAMFMQILASHSRLRLRLRLQLLEAIRAALCRAVLLITDTHAAGSTDLAPPGCISAI